jgi:hypothetical protein
LNDLVCGHIPLKTIVGKLVVHERPENIPANQNEFFYKFRVPVSSRECERADLIKWI